MKKIVLLLLLTISYVSNAQFWTEKATGFSTPSRSLNSISIVDANVIWANAYDNTDPLNTDFTIHQFTRSTDSGNTWVPGTIDIGPNSSDMDVSSITAVSATTAWVSVSPGTTNTGGIWKTTDSGVSWSKQPTAIYNSIESYPNFVYFWDANNGIAQGDPESGEFEIYTTTDGGANWVRVSGANIPDPLIAGEAGYYNLYSVSGNTIWFGTDKGRIFKSSDKGLNWSVAQSPSVDFGLDQFTFSDANKGLLMTYNPIKLFSTTDGGSTWSLTPIPYTGQLFNTNIAYIPGTSKVVSSAYANPLGSSYSLDDGLTWTTVDNGVFHGELAFLNDSFGFSAGMNINSASGGISKFNGIPPLSNAKFDVKTQFAAYPNPTNGMIHLDNGSNQIKQASIYDLKGRQVYSSKYSALYNVDLDLHSLQTGTYLLKLTSDSGKTETMKIMKN